jgi:hypothetical protein
MYTIDNQPASDSKLKGDQRVLRAFNARRRANRLVAVLHNLYREIAAEEQMSVTELQVRQYREIARFTASRDHIKLPPLDVTLIKWLQLGPLEQFGEPATAPYEWCYAILRSLQTFIAPAKFPEAFGPKVNDPFRFRAVSPDFIPPFMKMSQSGNALFPLHTTNRKDDRAFSCKMTRRPGTASDKLLMAHKQTFLAEQERELPEGEVSISNPMLFSTAESWRDQIRRALGFPELWVDFQVISFRVVKSEDPQTADTEKTLFHFVMPEKAITWIEFGEILSNTHANVVIEYSLRPIEMDDNSSFPFEHDGPPEAIAGDIILTTTNDIAEMEST